MSKRERTLAILVGLCAAAYGGKSFAWPKINEYLFGIVAENAQLRDDISENTIRLEKITPYREAYREFLARTGTTEPAEVENALHGELTKLIEQAGLGASHRISPRNITDYKPPNRRAKKVGIKLVRFSVTAEGKLDAVVRFLKSCYEVPNILRVTELKVDPPSVRNRKAGGLVKMTASIESLVPPKNETGEVDPADLEKPEKHVAHSGLDYTIIASRSPFTEYVKPPLPVKPKPKPKSKPAEPKPVPVKVAEVEPVVVPPPPPVDDPQRDKKYVRMVMMHDDVHEIYVVNTQDNSSEYISLGGKLDGGDIVLVHPLATAARREDGSTRIYPTGKRLADCLPVEEAGESYPEVAFAYDKIKDSLEPTPEVETDETPEKADGKGAQPSTPADVPNEKSPPIPKTPGAAKKTPGDGKKAVAPPAVTDPAANAEKEEPKKPERKPRVRTRNQKPSKTATKQGSDAKKDERPATSGGKTGLKKPVAADSKAAPPTNKAKADAKKKAAESKKTGKKPAKDDD